MPLKSNPPRDCTMTETELGSESYDFDPDFLRKEVNKPKLEGATSHVMDESDLFPSLDESCISLSPSTGPIENLTTSNHQYFSFMDDAEASDLPLFDHSFLSVDPFYSFSADELKSKVEGTPTQCSCEDFISLSLTWISSRMLGPFSGFDVDDSFSAK